MLHTSTRTAALVAVFAAAAAPFAAAQRPIAPATSPWSDASAEGPVELGELRLPDVRDLATVDLASFRGTPLLLVEFASW